MGVHEVRWMFHSTAMVTSYDTTVEAMKVLFGLRVLEYSEQLAPEVGRLGGMTWVGDNSLEIGQPIVEGAGADKFVKRTGGGIHSIALQVSDIEASIAHLESLGVRVAARPAEDFFFTDPRDVAGLFVEWAAVEMDEDPRFGEPPPPYSCEPLLDVTHHAFVGALVSDAEAAAERIASVFGTEITFTDPSVPPWAPRAGVSAGDCTLALYELDRADTAAMWGRTIDRPRTHVIGLRVPDLGDAAAALKEQGVEVLRNDEHGVLVDPAATGGAAVVLVDSLLPGDPRRGD